MMMNLARFWRRRAAAAPDCAAQARDWVLLVQTGRATEAHLCLLYTSPSPRDQRGYRMPSSA